MHNKDLSQVIILIEFTAGAASGHFELARAMTQALGNFRKIEFPSIYRGLDVYTRAYREHWRLFF